MFADHLLETDPADLSPWERQLLEQPAPGAPPAAAAAPAPAPQPPADPELRRDIDALLSLILGAQENAGAPPVGVDWPAVIAGMIQRGTATRAVITGAATTWNLIDDDDREDLLDQLG